MNKNYFLFGLGGLLIGLIIGFVAANAINRDAVTRPQVAQNPIVPKGPLAASQPNMTVKDPPEGMLNEVNETLEKAKNEPENFEVQTKAAEMYVQISKFDRAAELYEKALQIKPGDYKTTVSLGNTYFDLKQYETAEKWYQKALEKNPDDANVRTDLGITFIERPNPDYDRAAREFQTSLQKNPRHELAAYNLGVAYFKKGNLEEAQKASQQLDSINAQGQLAGRLRQILGGK